MGITYSKDLVSIVTPSFNQGNYIEEHIHSVSASQHPSVQHIIIDGGSTDNTLSILKKYPHLEWVSEPDKGQSDAINKGFRAAKGEIIGWLNADDLYYRDAISYAYSFFKENPDIDFIYGNLLFINEKGDITEFLVPVEFDLSFEINYGNIIPQPTIFFRKKLLDKAGYLKENLHYTMDVEFWIRIAKLGLNIKKVNQTLAFFRLHPTSKTTSQADKFWNELRATCRYYGSKFHNAMLHQQLHRQAPRQYLKQLKLLYQYWKEDKAIRIKYFNSLSAS